VTQCAYTKPDGEQCGSNAQSGSRFCQHHPPDVGAERLEELEALGFAVLEELAVSGRGETTRRKASEALVEYGRGGGE